MNSALQTLLQRPDVWRSRDRRSAMQTARGHTTGFAQLDRELRGGWPQASLIELLLAQTGIGELSLLLPLLAASAQKQLLNVWINPPFIPYAPALMQRGVALDTLLIVRGETQHHLWACEQALRSPACNAVLFWPAKPLRYAELRKLQVAAAAQHAMAFLFRDRRAAQQNSPAALRLQLDAVDSASGAQLALHILKQRGQAGGQKLWLPRERELQATPAFTAASSRAAKARRDVAITATRQNPIARPAITASSVLSTAV